MKIKIVQNALKIMQAIMVSKDLKTVMSMCKLYVLEAGEAINFLEVERLVYYDKNHEIKMTMKGQNWYNDNIENPILLQNTMAFKEEALTGLKTVKSKNSGFIVSQKSEIKAAVLGK